MAFSMQIDYRSDHEVSSEAARKATGRSREEWFADLDALGGAAQGRKLLGDYLAKDKKIDAWWTVTLSSSSTRRPAAWWSAQAE